MQTQTLLIVDDKADIRLSLKFLFKNHGFLVQEASDLSQARALLNTPNYAIDLVLLDMNYEFDTTSGEEGLTFLKQMQGTQAPPIIAMTAWSSVNLAVEAMQVGAKDFFAKPWDNHAVLMMVKKQLALADIEKASATSPTPASMPVIDGLLWHSSAMQQLKRQIDRIAKTDATVFLRGENGTGKTCIAQYLHQQSLRKGAFVGVNVAAIPENLFESELFGHKKGAFTDAKQDRVGRFAKASGGTLFLDEVGTLGLNQQAKLLRVLESQEYELVGDNTTQVADCRVISASNADFEQLMSTGAFRTDLYFRLNTIELVIPPLRERLDEINTLAEHFLKLHSQKYQLEAPTLTEEALELMHAYHWPGNVRELSHMMARSVLMNEHGAITIEDLACLQPTSAEQAPSSPLPLMTLEEAELKLLKMAMAQSNNQVEDAALLLGISKSAIYRRLDKFNIKTK
ncbi:sigma-54-dependent transcriptional regulator [Pseudoalteromonas ulvae]|uniref:Sigma-54-dependent Fis family transcriptional regulator n=1 Tax=Pseudoalteromonas ulvae TaxID=107327 RepID=A0A244CR86_PSEDV|nr:sigma-54 dependent transcriptional regulator [Pseudoalteromonas ulvae]OUL57996.1 sigma-54-dependent Fis family transcriptional regulator [Pseudoalteromonas ulvae]